jgi:hypothetical protein
LSLQSICYYCQHYHGYCSCTIQTKTYCGWDVPFYDTAQELEDIVEEPRLWSSGNSYIDHFTSLSLSPQCFITNEVQGHVDPLPFPYQSKVQGDRYTSMSTHPNPSLLLTSKGTWILPCHPNPLLILHLSNLLLVRVNGILRATLSITFLLPTW